MKPPGSAKTGEKAGGIEAKEEGNTSSSFCAGLAASAVREGW
jgi:hypothetical protein